jgi:hypothetical protein
MNRPTKPMVVVDPSHREGEAGLALAIDAGAPRATLVLAIPVGGPPARALKEYAIVEAISITEAAHIYASQLIDRIAASGGTVAEVTHLDGIAAVEEVVIEAQRLGVDAVFLPGRGAILSDKERSELSARTAVDVIDPHMAAA